MSTLFIFRKGEDWSPLKFKKGIKFLYYYMGTQTQALTICESLSSNHSTLSDNIRTPQFILKILTFKLSLFTFKNTFSHNFFFLSEWR